MIQIGDKILVRCGGGGTARAIVVEVGDVSALWRLTTNQKRSTLQGTVLLADEGLNWTPGWEQDSYNVLRFIEATENR